MMGIPRSPLPRSLEEAERLVRGLVGNIRLTEAESHALSMVLELVHEVPTTTLLEEGKKP